MSATSVLRGLHRDGPGIQFLWGDGVECRLLPTELRQNCPCAHCVDETTGIRVLDPDSVPSSLELKDMKPVGNYAYRCLFSDGHDTGIYTLELLRELCEGLSDPD